MNRAEPVVLLHGIAQSHLRMKPLEMALKRAGYPSVSFTYPSRRANLAGLAAFVAEQLDGSARCAEADKIHFVTHSMGGLVAERSLTDFRATSLARKVGRVVMIAPPNGGSEVADFLSALRLYRWLYGPAGQELTTHVQTKLRDETRYELGIIAGSVSWPYLLGNFVIKKPHDGRVSVERTRHSGMTDHVVVPATHTFISRNPAVHTLVIQFLSTGRFGSASSSLPRQ